MKYLISNSFSGLNFPFVVDGKKQELRRARRQGLTTARQQIKAAKAHRRELKLLAA